MRRIVKRFLLRRQRENDKGEEGDVEQIKQDLQMFRFEMHNDLKRSRLNYLKSLAFVHSGISILGDESLKNGKPENLEKFLSFKAFGNDIDGILDEVKNKDS